MSRFTDLAGRLPDLLQALLDCQPVLPNRLPAGLPQRGVYLFSEGDHHLYVGRSRNLRRRIGQHCQPRSMPGVAAFAMLLAREETGLRATYRRGEGRATLLLNPRFARAFVAAKTRIREMNVRFVGVDDVVAEALLEIYAALELPTLYNDFDTH